jgi:uncharacterized protein YciI
MLFVLMGLDRQGDGAEVRRQNRAAHLQFVVENEDKFRYGGALLDDNQKMIGSLMMVELPDRAALDHFLKTEPYSRAGLFEPYVVRETRQVVPQREPGFLAAELAAEKTRP